MFKYNTCYCYYYYFTVEISTKLTKTWTFLTWSFFKFAAFIQYLFKRLHHSLQVVFQDFNVVNLLISSLNIPMFLNDRLHLKNCSSIVPFLHWQSIILMLILYLTVNKAVFPGDPVFDKFTFIPTLRELTFLNVIFHLFFYVSRNLIHICFLNFLKQRQLFFIDSKIKLFSRHREVTVLEKPRC